MREKFRQNLFQMAPLLFKAVAKEPSWEIALPDDLFPFLRELTEAVEKFNRRYPKRCVRVLKIAINEGELEFVLNRQIPSLQKRIASTRCAIRLYRKNLRETFLARAKRMGSTALFGSSLLPDWKRLMPDDHATLRKILGYAEKFALSPGDRELISLWHKRYLAEDYFMEKQP